jgi:hypothetical protein
MTYQTQGTRTFADRDLIEQAREHPRTRQPFGAAVISKKEKSRFGKKPKRLGGCH